MRSRSSLFGLSLAASLATALAAWFVPLRRMPYDWNFALHGSLPLALVWAALAGFGFWRFRFQALWFLVGAPAALWWPYMLVAYGLPGCYIDGHCM